MKGYIPLYSILAAQHSPTQLAELLVLHDSAILRCKASCKEECDAWIDAINKTTLRVKPQCACACVLGSSFLDSSAAVSPVLR